VSLTRFTGQAIVASWKQPFMGADRVVSFCAELMQRFPHITTIHIDVTAPSYVRVLVVEGQGASDLRAELAAALNVAMPGVGAETRIEAAPEFSWEASS